MNNERSEFDEGTIVHDAGHEGNMGSKKGRLFIVAFTVIAAAALAFAIAGFVQAKDNAKEQTDVAQAQTRKAQDNASDLASKVLKECKKKDKQSKALHDANLCGDAVNTKDRVKDNKDIGSVAGLQGTRGSIGMRGLKGSDGKQGPEGEQGEVGPLGLPGLVGGLGPKGDQGKKGDSTVGPQGKTGPQGDVGPKGEDSTVPGPKGPVGPQGIRGLSGSDSGLEGVSCSPNGRALLIGYKGTQYRLTAPGSACSMTP